MIKINSNPLYIVMLQVYFPISNSNEEDICDMYEQINKTLKSIKNTTNILIMGDINASVDNNTYQREIGTISL